MGTGTRVIWPKAWLAAAAIGVFALPAQPAAAAHLAAAAGGADLRVTISGPATAPADTVQHFSYTVVNAGPDTATNVVLIAALPTGGAYASWNGPDMCTSYGPVWGAELSCTYASIASGQSVTLDYGGYMYGVGTDTATASVASDTTDPTLANDTASTTIDVLPVHADEFAYLLGPSRASVGQDLEYQLNIGASGPDLVYGPIPVTIELPPSVDTPPGITMAGPYGTSCSNGSDGSFTCTGGNPEMTCRYPGNGARSLTCSVEDQRGIGPGPGTWGYGSVWLDLHASSAGSVPITATVQPRPQVVDNDPLNDLSSVPLQVYDGPIPAQADLAVTETAPADAEPGGSFAYTVAVHNDGPDDAAGVAVSDTLPAGVAFVSASGGTCTGTSSLSCDLGPLARSATATLTINVRAGTAEGDQTNIVTASSTTIDPDSTNDTASATTLIHPFTADLAVSVAAPAGVQEGTPGFAESITVRNLGPDPSRTRVRGNVPPGLRLSYTQHDCFTAGEGFECSSGTIASSASQTLTVYFDAPSPPPAEAQTTTVSLFDQSVPDPNAANDTASATTTITPYPRADIVGAIVGPSDLHLGDTLVYRLTITNAGPATSAWANVNTDLPSAAFADVTVTSDRSPTTCSTGPNGSLTLVACSLQSTVDVGGTWTLEVHARAIAAGSWIVEGHGNGSRIDPDTTNNGGTFTVNVPSPAPTITCPADVDSTSSNVDPGTATFAGGTAPVTVAGARSDGRPLDAPYPFATTTVTWTALDAAGRTADCDQHVLVRDVDPPSTTVTGVPTAWSASDVTLHFGATDNDRVAEIRYDAGGATTSIVGAAGDATFHTEGVTTVTYFAVDASGNREAAHTVQLRIDETAPDVRCDTADGVWHGANVTIECRALDGGAGIGAGDASFSLTTHVADGDETADAPTESRLVCDAVGNCATAGPVGGNRVDRKAPRITLTTPPDGGSFVLGQRVAADYDCADAGAGVARCSGPLPSGAAIDTSAAGQFDFAVTAADAVGNEATTSHSYHVGYAICGFSATGAVHRAGSTVPLRLELCDAGGADVSSTAIALRATSLDGAAAPDSPSNAGGLFAFDGTAYTYNLRLPRNLRPGSHTFAFSVSGDRRPYTVTIETR